jgi:dTDP-4-amino-4,6-dideoxygalactose transaminase
MRDALRFQRPILPESDAIERYLSLSRAERWFSNFGPCSELLQARLSGAAGRPCVLVANATLGLMAAIATLRDQAPTGADEVLVPSFAFAASAQAVVWNRLHPVFVDVGDEHWHLDPQRLEEALARRAGRVALVLALSSFGVPPPVRVRERWEQLCLDAGVPLLVDSAAGFGAHAADGVAVGAQGDAEVVSFHALKPLSSGEGGAVFCRTEELADEVGRLVNFTFDDQHQAQRPDGLNAKMSEPTAAIGLASLDGLDAALANRHRVAQEILDGLPDSFAKQAGHERGTWQFVPVAAPNPAARSAVLDDAILRGIGVRTYYDPLHLMPAFAGCELADDLQATVRLGERMVSLPMAVDLNSEEIEAVVGLAQVAVAATTQHA